MSDDVLTREDIKVLTSKNALEWLSQKASDAESRSGHIIGGTNAQALYRKFREKCWTREAMKMIAEDIKDETQRAEKRNELIKEKMEEVFSSIGLSGFGEILLKECKKQ